MVSLMHVNYRRAGHPCLLLMMQALPAFTLPLATFSMPLLTLFANPGMLMEHVGT